jgi:DNA repair exonuclease SbcCD ATPase subunit
LNILDLKRNFASYKEEEGRVLLGLDDFSGRNGGPKPLSEE